MLWVRGRKGDAVDHTAGIRLLKTVGDYVYEGDEIATLYTSSKADTEQIAADFQRYVLITVSQPRRREHIFSVLRA